MPDSYTEYKKLKPKMDKIGTGFMKLCIKQENSGSEELMLRTLKTLIRKIETGSDYWLDPDDNSSPID